METCELDAEHSELIRLRAEIDKLRAALTEIARGEGAYNRDPLTHASNTIDSMKALAATALEEKP